MTLGRTKTANLFLIGAPKAGTTSLATWLAQHPDIYWSVPKEPQFWSSDYPRMRAHYGFAERTSYTGLYASDEAARAPWRGDGSTTYLYSSAAVPSILAEQPDARFIACLRRPDELVPSYHRTQLTALNETEPDVEKAWRRAVRGEPVPGDPLDPKLLDYPTIGSIGAAAARVASLVPTGNLAFVVFDDLKSRPVETYQQVTTFLGIDAGHEAELVARNASDKAARFDGLRRITHRPPPWLAPGMARFRQWSRHTSLPGVQRVKSSMWRKADRPHVSNEFTAELRQFFAEDIDTLEAVLGRGLDDWRG